MTGQFCAAGEEAQADTALAVRQCFPARPLFFVLTPNNTCKDKGSEVWKGGLPLQNPQRWASILPTSPLPKNFQEIFQFALDNVYNIEYTTFRN